MKIGHYIDIGKPIEVNNKSMRIYPLFYQGGHSRDYRLIEELESLVDLVDSGQIDKVYIKNRSKYPVFIRAGNIISGKTQNRGIKRSILIFPKSKKKSYSNIDYVKSAEVFCVHQSSPISSGGTFTVNCLVPHEFESLAYSGAPQNMMWSCTTHYSHDITGFSNDNLLDTVKVITEKHEDIIDKIINDNPWILDAVGVAIVDSVGILALELYDSQESWSIMTKKILNKYSLDFAKRVSSYTTGQYWKTIESTIKTLLNSNFKVLAKYSDSLTVDDKKWLSVTYQGNIQDKYEGELTKLNKKVIHLAIVRGTKFNYTDKGPIQIEY